MNIFFLIITLLFPFGFCSCSYSTGSPRHPVELKFHSDVFVWYPDGRVKRISSGKGIFYQPSIHPEGTYAVYYGNSSGSPRIWRADLRKNKVVALTPPGWAAYHASYSWDGSKIVFASDKMSAGRRGRVEEIYPSGILPRNRTCNIFTMNPDGRGIIQITRGNYEDQRPAFSPDGKNIAFVQTAQALATGYT